MKYPGTIKISRDELFLSALLVLVTIAAPLSYLPFLPLLVIIISFLLLYKEKFALIYTIITFLTVTTTLSPSLRSLIQITNIILLGFYFFKYYGLSYKLYPSVPNSFALFLLALISLMIISSVNSNLLLGLEQVFRLTVFLIIVYFCYSLICREKNNYKLILKSFYIIAFVYSGYLLFEFAGSNFNIIQYNLSQVTSLGNEYLPKNLMGAFFSTIITLTFSYFFFFQNDNRKYFLVVVISLSLISLVLLNARTSILTVIIGFIYVSFHFKRKLIIWMISGIIFISLLMLIDPIYEIFEIYFRFEKISTGRDYILSAAINVIKDNWVLGAGPAGTKFELYKNLPFMLNSPIEQFMRFHYNEIEFGHAHNFYLFFFSDLGIAGFILSLLFPVLFFRYGLRVLKNLNRSSFDYYTMIGIMGSGLCMFIRGLFEWGGLISYGTINSDLPFWLLFVTVIYFYQHKEKTGQSI